MTAKNLKALMKNQAIKNGDEWFAHAQRVLESGLRDLKNYRQQFKDAGSDPKAFSKPHDVLGFAANSLVNLSHNFRFDLLPSRTADLINAEHTKED